MDKVRAIVRIANTDLDGNKKVYYALRKIKGVSFMFSSAICNLTDLDKNKKVGILSDKEIKDIEDVISNPKKFPKWMLNRRKDYETGEDFHIIGSKLKLTKEFDIKRLKKVKSYRGMRHAFGLPVRGQKTRSHFRHGRSVGVQKKKIKQQKAGKKSGGEK
ncbi:30S ribosomal protein S13 [Candidatus Woesearchaeota archaeon]|nr:30S ribosomal protein S13 [Candidatus Woesearchaeota archaeon]